MSNSPQFVVYTIVETGQGRKDFWQRVGSAWSNKDGSLNITLNALPVNGKLHVRAPSAREDDMQHEEQLNNAAQQLQDDVTF